MFKKLLLSLLCTASLVQAAEAPQVKFGFIDVYGEIHYIQRCFVDPQIRNIPADKLEVALKHFVIRLVQLDNGEYCVRAHVKGLGGGPVTASVAYWSTKAVGYGSYIAVCWFQPHALAEAAHVYEIVEIAAAGAYGIGMIAPTA